MTRQDNPGLHGPEAEKVLSEALRLQTDRRFRQLRGEFFVEGVRNIVLLSDNHFVPRTILFSEKLLIAPLARKLVRRWRRAGIPTINLTPENFRRISKTERASGVGAIVGERWQSLEKVEGSDGLCWVLLGVVRSAGNFGTLMRTAMAVGAAGFILLDGQLDPYDPATVRASMGAAFGLRFVRANLATVRQWAAKHQVEVIGASPDGRMDFHDYSFVRTRALLMGEERMGLTTDQRALCRELVRIPMRPGVDSLNLGVAGSLILYEIFRARERKQATVVGVDGCKEVPISGANGLPPGNLS
jgi:TrmH family RNA methyltransferase